MSLLPPLQQLSISLISAFLSVLHKFNVLSASASPTTSARSRFSLPRSLYLLPVSLSFFRWLLSHSQVNVSNNVRLLCFCLLLKAVSFCLSISPFLSDIMVCLGVSWFLSAISVSLMVTRLTSVYLLPEKTSSLGPEWLESYIQAISMYCIQLNREKNNNLHYVLMCYKFALMNLCVS